MANANTEFWINLLSLGDDKERRSWIWNGYLGWKLPPHVKEEIESKDGWPKLTESDEVRIEILAQSCGGYPKFDQNYMDFSQHLFHSGIDLSGLTFVNSNFSGANFTTGVSLFNEARFFGQTYFNNTMFEIVQFFKTKFDAPVYFESSQFRKGASFNNVDFIGGASFKHAKFEGDVHFSDSKFEDKYYSGTVTVYELANFRNAKFMDRTSFRNVHFGSDDKTSSSKVWFERVADFTDAQFNATTDFRKAVFMGAPAFFNTTLHEDTDFGGIDWEKAETADISADYAIRAWERLELMMSKLEKPLERHQFYRLKMRARRRKDKWFLSALNRIFEVTSDYGWNVRRAFLFWFGHWFGLSLFLYVNSGTDAIQAEGWKLVKASLGTGFANAHAFLGLVTEEGYLAECRQVLVKNNTLGFLAEIGTIEAFLGPIFLFLLLLTLRNQFRLA